MLKKKIMIIGSTGMLGSQITRYFYKTKKYNIICIIRNKKKFNLLKIKNDKLNIIICNLVNIKKLEKLIKKNKPDYLINCVGMVKQIMNSSNRKLTYFLNVIIPKRLSKLALSQNFKLIHFSTDCVFSGTKGNYSEKNKPDCKDFYGITKLKGEVKSNNTINLRTSIIGHELNTKVGLLEWFMDSKKKVYGFKKAVFSGLTTLEIAKFLDVYIIKKDTIKSGLFHLSSKPINKFSLLKLISKIYNKNILITPETSNKCDRSLNSNKLKRIVKYKSKSWQKMLIELKHEYLKT
jgi:dTDP-4-dehydrorhamnose reductase